MGAEANTTLLILEARDKASAIFARVSGAMDRFEAAAGRAAGVAESAGTAIDTSLLQTASGADAAVLASARLAAAQQQVTVASEAQATAERELLAAQEALAAAADGDAEANARLAAAMDALTVAEKQAAAASRATAAAQTLQADTGAAVIARADAELAADDRLTAARARVAAAGRASAAGTAAMSATMKTGAVVAAAVAAVSVKAAGDFESSTQHLVTDAGESQKNLKMIQQGILDIAASTGTSAMKLSDAMYHVESAGYHGAAALQLLKTSAEGAKVGGADFETVAKTLTGTMNSYGMAGDQAVAMMNQLITTTASGDMRMQDLASSLGNVAPLAAAAGLSFSQVGGAMATMTAQNMSAQQAAQDLANTIRALSNPNNVAIKEMQNLGLSSNDLSENLGKRGLTGTLDILTRAVAAHTQGGQVLISTFNNAKQAAENANIMIKAMPPNLQKVAEGYLNGSTTLGEWRKELKTLPPVQAAMMQQFATLANRTHSFNDMLKGGTPAAQTYNAAMAKLLGGATGLNTALMITGGRAEEFNASTERIAEAAKHGGKTVEDWDKIQQTFNQKLDRAKYSIEAAGISIGMVLLPAASTLMDVIMDILGPITSFVDKHKTLVGLVASVAAGMLLAAGAIRMVALATRMWAAAQGFVNAAMAVFDAEEALTGIPELIILIAGLVAGLIYAWNHFETFRKVVTTVFEAVAVAGKAVWRALVVAWDALVTAAKATWHALDAAWRAVAGAAKTVWSAITAVWNAIWGVTTTVWNAISGFFRKWWPLLLVIFLPAVALVMAIWNHFHEQIISVAKTAWNAVLTALKFVWGVIKTAAGVAWDGIRIAIIDPILAVWHGLQAIWNTISPWLKTAWHGIRAAASAIWDGIKSSMIDPITSAWHTIVSTVDHIKTAIKTGLDSAWTAVSNIGDKFLSIGKAIVEGIARGVTSSAGEIAKAAKDAAGSALNAAKSFLGIGSPSRVFADEVGQWIPAGVAQGVTKYAHVATKAVGGFASGLPGAARGTSLAPVAAGASGGGTVINFDLRGSKVMSDKDMDIFVDKIGRALATRILPSGGVRIRM
jgi:TP901 family phage tail tape measure protein